MRSKASDELYPSVGSDPVAGAGRDDDAGRLGFLRIVWLVGIGPDERLHVHILNVFRADRNDHPITEGDSKAAIPGERSRRLECLPT